jgi:hypothetical protein
MLEKHADAFRFAMIASKDLNIPAERKQNSCTLKV